MKETHILVTGNGFDLYHGFKTTYKDFTDTITAAMQIQVTDRSDVEKKLANLGYTNGFIRYFQAHQANDNTWEEFEAQLEELLRVFIDLFAKIRALKNDTDFDITRFSLQMQTFTFFQLKTFQRFFKIFEQAYDDSTGGLYHIRPEFITANKQLDEHAIILELRAELDEFAEALGNYLNTETAKPCDIRFAPFEDLSFSYVVNFNYTNTCERYHLSSDQIFYVKGKSFTEPKNMILGIPDESEDHLDFIFFKNYFQNIIKFTGALEVEQLKKDPQEHVTAHIFGHSLTNGDASTLKLIFDTVDHSVIYYKDQDDYAMKVIELIRMLGKDVVMKHMQKKIFIFQKIA